MDEMNRQMKKKAADQDRVINIGDISSISGGTINISGGDIQQDSRTIHTEGGSYIEGNVNTGGGDFVGRDKISFDTEMNGIFTLSILIQRLIAARQSISPEEKDDLMVLAKDLEYEVGLGEMADEGNLARRLRFLGKLDPEILLAVLQKLVDPAAGFSSVVRRVAEKMSAAYDGTRV